MTGARTGLPAQIGLQPRWRDLPRLALVQCRAFGPFAPPFAPHLPRTARPTGGPARAVANVVWSWLVLPVWASLQLGCRAAGLTAGIGTTAVVTVTPVGRERCWHRLALMTGVAGLMVAAVVIVVYLLPALLTGRLWPGKVLLSVIAVPTLIDVGYRASRASRATNRPDLGVETYEVGALAAWPLSHGHGTTLLRALCCGCDALDRPLALILTPREGLETYYRRHGFTPDTTSCYYVRHPPPGAGT